jgi:hypothetical protein
MPQLTEAQVQDILQQLAAYLEDLKTRWQQQNPGNNSWWGIHRTYLLTASIFVINAVDELIQFVETLVIPTGADKKAAVLAVCNELFDFIIAQAFPFWLRPFAPTIKEIVVNIVLSSLIDFIVAKYNAGYWKMERTNGPTNQEK